MRLHINIMLKQRDNYPEKSSGGTKMTLREKYWRKREKNDIK